MKRWLCLLLSIGFLQMAFATDDGTYAMSKINPLLLLSGPYVIKRAETKRYEIKDAGRAVLYHKYAITIMNENGDEEAQLFQFYDKFNKINFIEGALYDANGKKIKELKKSELADRSATGDNFADDSRIKTFQFYYRTYPYTVEYEVELEKSELLFMPSWVPQSHNMMCVEQSSFEIIMPADYSIRYKSYNYKGEPIVASEGKRKKMIWEAKNMLPQKGEPYAPNWEERTINVITAATDFEIQGYKGNMSTWKEFGKFQVALNKGRDELPPQTKQTVHQLTDGLSNPYDKINTLYEYMQKNTRYISIQLGVGGWQPLLASEVATKGYGDCKALTNYMHSLLKEAGINSNYVIIKAGDNNRSYIPDFPSRQSNHAILCVPLKQDTIWLECTSQTLPAGYLSSFTCNRYALMIQEDGGYLVRTPEYKMKDNVQARFIKATLNQEGQLTANVTTHYTGTQQDDLHSLIHGSTKLQQLEHLKKSMGELGTYDVKNFEYKEHKSMHPYIDESIALVVDNYAQISGKRIFIAPNLLNKSSVKLKDEDRTNDIDLVFEFKDVDSIEIAIPAGYVAESTPKDINLQSKFGNYSISFKVANDKVIMYRNFERLSGRFPKTDYKEFVKFYEDMYKADRSRIVLVKKEA